MDATRRMLLEELPPVLVLHLKWFTYDKNGGLQKCIKQVDFDIELEIGKGSYCSSFLLPVSVVVMWLVVHCLVLCHDTCCVRSLHHF